MVAVCNGAGNKALQQTERILLKSYFAPPFQNSSKVPSAVPK
jgi:hypothetical protein